MRRERLWVEDCAGQDECVHRDCCHGRETRKGGRRSSLERKGKMEFPEEKKGTDVVLPSSSMDKKAVFVQVQPCDVAKDWNAKKFLAEIRFWKKSSRFVQIDLETS